MRVNTYICIYVEFDVYLVSLELLHVIVRKFSLLSSFLTFKGESVMRYSDVFIVYLLFTNSQQLSIARSQGQAALICYW